MTTYTNPTNIFNFLPNDVLQWGISPFLAAEERAEFNAVLESTERVSRRFPQDRIIAHVLRTTMKRQRVHASELIFWMDQGAVSRVRRLIGRYVTFLCRPMTAILFQYHEGAKTNAINELQMFLDEDAKFDDEIRVQLSPAIRLAILDTIEHIHAIPFERHIQARDLL
jgi:hypothetical protein